jgi:predicted Zn-dependent peptidase
MKNAELVTLDNGTKLLCLHRPNFHTSSVRIKIFAGSLHESTPGSAHFFEHIAFQGTEKFPSQTILEEFCENNAIFKNAYTTKVDTVFFADGLELESTLQVATQLAYHPLLTPESLEKERAAVIDEARSYQFAPGADALSQHLKNIGGDKYGELITGTIDQIEKVTHKDLIDYHATNYHTNNSLIIICSKESIETQTKLVKALIKKTATQKSVTPQKVDLQWLEKDTTLSLQNNKLDPQSQTYVSTVYKLPPAKTYDQNLRQSTAAIVLSKVAHKHLRQDLVISYSAQAGLSHLINQNYGISESFDALYLFTYTSGDKALTALDELLKIPEIACSKRDLIASVITTSAYEAALRLEETTAQAASNAIGSEQIRFDGEYNPQAFHELVKNTTVDDVIEDIRTLTKNLSATQITSPDQNVLDEFANKLN